MQAPASQGRRRCLRLAFGAAAALGVGQVSTQGARLSPRVRVIVGPDEALCHLPLTVAQELGYFKAAGIEVSIGEHAGQGRALEALNARQADVLSTSYFQVMVNQAAYQAEALAAQRGTTTSRGLSQAQDLQAFLLEGRLPMLAMGVSFQMLPQYRDLGDLRWHRIGVSGEGSLSEVLVQLMLRKANISTDHVTWVRLGTVSHAAIGVRERQVEALCHIDPAMTELEQRGELRLIADTRTLKGAASVFGGPMPSSCLAALRSFVAENPQTCQAMGDAVVRALRWLQTAEPLDIIKILPESQTALDRSLFLAAFQRVRECYSPDGSFAPEATQTAWQAATTLGLATSVEPQTVLDRSFTNEFVHHGRLRPKA